jgi:hypothetical protein
MEQKLSNIPEPEISDQDQKLNETVAVNPATVDYDNEKMLFSFLPYNQNKCQLAKLEPKEAKQLTKQLRRVNEVLKKHLMYREQSGLDCRTITYGGNYCDLFNDLPPDVDQLIEIDYSTQGRIIGYITRNIFNISVILKNHTKY